MRVLKLISDFHVDKESLVIPVWIALDHLPLHFSDKQSLYSIASMIGQPLKIDGSTSSLSKPNVARLEVTNNGSPADDTMKPSDSNPRLLAMESLQETRAVITGQQGPGMKQSQFKLVRPMKHPHPRWELQDNLADVMVQDKHFVEHFLLREVVVDDQHAWFCCQKKKPPLKCSEILDSVKDTNVVAWEEKTRVQLADELQQFTEYLRNFKFHSNENKTNGFIEMVRRRHKKQYTITHSMVTCKAGRSSSNASSYGLNE
ncbi:hypothetical protein ACH5RR_025949 [Cinchona calisaya]|uniref:DUF4283 domain-containing protein n=1 Tax=Cinchona calisaya TaxID=153742 RepID=A0ABD2Z4B2_9GENT